MREATRNEIVRLRYAGASQRAIALQLGIDRKSVYRVLKEHQEQPGPEKRKANARAARVCWTLIADRIAQLAGTLPGSDRRPPARRTAPAGLRGPLRHREGTPARHSSARAESSGAAVRDRSWRAGSDGLFALRHSFLGRRPAAGACVQLCAELLAPPVSALCGVTGFHDHHPRTCPRLRILPGTGRDLSLRQHESGSHQLRRRPAHL